MKLRSLVASSLLLGCAFLAQALEIKPYTAAALAQAQAANQPVAIHFHADWCPTCRAQDQALELLKADPALGITVLKANYDTEKDLKRRFNIRTQSTLVVLHGKTESARLVGETGAPAIATALKAAL